jgi:hypothetical protein
MIWLSDLLFGNMLEKLQAIYRLAFDFLAFSSVSLTRLSTSHLVIIAICMRSFQLCRAHLTSYLQFGHGSDQLHGLFERFKASMATR